MQSVASLMSLDRHGAAAMSDIASATDFDDEDQDVVANDDALTSQIKAMTSDFERVTSSDQLLDSATSSLEKGDLFQKHQHLPLSNAFEQFEAESLEEDLGDVLSSTKNFNHI